LSMFVCDFIGGVCVYKDHAVGRTPAGIVMNGGDPLGTLNFYGIAEDARMASEVFNELRLVIISMAQLRYGRHAKGDGAAYSEGFVSGLIANHKKDVEALRLTNNSERGLILIQRRDELVKYKKEISREGLIETTQVKLSKGRGGGSKAGSREARMTGHSDGQKYDVTKTTTRKLN
jgi:hypothetical protein